MRKGSADITLNSLSADMAEALRREEHLDVAEAPGTSYQYIALNMEDEKLTLPVRQAIAHAVNREEMITHLWRNTVRPASSILPPEHWAHDPGLVPYDFDPERARALLDEAGFRPGPDGIRLHIEMKTSTDQIARELAAVLQQQLREVGIALEIRSYEFATFYADIIRGSFELYSLRWVAGNDDPDIFEFCFHSASIPPKGANRGRYRNAEVDRLIEEARVSSNQDERRAKYLQIQEIVHRDLPYIHLWYVDDVAVFHRRLGELRLEMGNYDFLRQVSAQMLTGG
jgi:peptide/nickel transport system substrate-binding protein